MCPENDWRTLELHHIAGNGRHEAMVISCFNCHRKCSDMQKDHPPVDPGANSLLDTIGHYLLGLADTLKYIVETLYKFGHALIDFAKPQPSGQMV